MIRGASAGYKFNLAYKFSDLKNVKILFWQDGNDGPSNDRPLPIIKVLQQCTQGDTEYQLYVTLNQEETLRFSDKRKAKAQLRALTSTGIPFSSKERLITVYPVYDDSILGDEVLPTPSHDGWIYLDGEYVT